METHDLDPLSPYFRLSWFFVGRIYIYKNDFIYICGHCQNHIKSSQNVNIRRIKLIKRPSGYGINHALDWYKIIFLLFFAPLFIDFTEMASRKRVQSLVTYICHVAFDGIRFLSPDVRMQSYFLKVVIVPANPRTITYFLKVVFVPANPRTITYALLLFFMN